MLTANEELVKRKFILINNVTSSAENFFAVILIFIVTSFNTA